MIMSDTRAIDTLELNRPFAYTELQCAVDRGINAIYTMILVKEEMERIAQDNYREVDKYNTLRWVLEQFETENKKKEENKNDH